MAKNYWRITGNSFRFGFLQTPACFLRKQAGVQKKAGGMFLTLHFC